MEYHGVLTDRIWDYYVHIHQMIVMLVHGYGMRVVVFNWLCIYVYFKSYSSSSVAYRDLI